MKKLILTLGLLGLLAGVSAADPTDPRNHDVNPAFLADSHRGILDLGFNLVDFEVQNSYLGVGT